jgi:acyl carrier protein
MGLDTVELVMEVEEAFGITIPDAEAEKILTIGDLYRYVLAKLDGPALTTPGCPSAAVFYRLRRQLMGRFRVERRRIRPASPLDDLVPATDRRQQWQRLGECLGWRLPGLSRPGWVGFVFLGLFIPWAVATIVAWGRLAGFALDALMVFFFGLLVGAILLGVAVYQVTRPFATVLPAHDIRGLIPMILGRNVGTFRINNPQGWTSKDVWDALIAIIAEQLGVAPDQLNESTSFVNDLGLS